MNRSKNESNLGLALGDLRVFLRVAELSHFGGAAESLGLSRARVSQGVQALERQLGVRLLQRTTRKVLLTDEGARVVLRARQLLADADDLATEFQRQPSDVRGHVRIDLPVRLALRVVLPALPSFLEAHPQLTLAISSSDRRVDPVRDGFDCVLRVGPLGDSPLVARSLGWMPQCNAAAPSYLQRYGRPESIADLAAHRLIHYSQRLDEQGAAFEWLDAGRLQSLQMASVLCVNHTDAYEAAARAGMGLIQAPEIGLREALSSGELERVLLSHEPPPMPVHLLWPHRQLSRRARVVVDWLDAVLRPFMVSTTMASSF